jgi:hypothetical protein
MTFASAHLRSGSRPAKSRLQKPRRTKPTPSREIMIVMVNDYFPPMIWQEKFAELRPVPADIARPSAPHDKTN